MIAGASGAQAISGFGFALIAVPLLSLFIDPRVAVVLATFVGAFSSTFQAIVDRRYVDKNLVRRLVLSAYVGMPFGLGVFILVSEDTLRVIVGVVVLLAAVFLIKGFTVLDSTKKYDWIMGAVSGLLATSTSTNGPPLVFLMQAKKMNPQSFRASINVVFSFSSFGAIVLFIASGNVSLSDVTGIVISIPMLLLGLFVGFRLRSRINPEQFRILVFVLLITSAVSALASPLIN